ncbi:hypothetical protein GCM10010236_34970 [Streptomyces eurythermus]|nr:hypothetical protein GCM10010236_34970 [Streptomyces eurythermus]
MAWGVSAGCGMPEGSPQPPCSGTSSSRPSDTTTARTTPSARSAVIRPTTPPQAPTAYPGKGG